MRRRRLYVIHTTVPSLRRSCLIFKKNLRISLLGSFRFLRGAKPQGGSFVFWWHLNNFNAKEDIMAAWPERYRSWEAWSKGQEEAAVLVAPICGGGCQNLDRRDERRVFELPTEEKVRLCAVYRGRGDALYLEGQFFRASLWYRKSLSYYDYTFPEDEKVIDALEATRYEVLIGLAKCDLRAKLYREVLKHCYQALQMEKSAEAYLLRGTAYRELDDYDASRSDFSKISDADLRQQELTKLHARQKAYALRSKELCQRILNGVTTTHKQSSLVSSSCVNKTKTPEEDESQRRNVLLRRAQAIFPTPLTARDRDALDDLYTPHDAASLLSTVIMNRTGGKKESGYYYKR